MRYHHFVFYFVTLAMLLMGATYAQVLDSSETVTLKGINARSNATVITQTQGALDEQIEIQLIYPIPIMQAPIGCVVTLIERYCRVDNKPVTSFIVLHQRTLGLSSIEKIAINNGCVVIEAKLGVEEDKTGNAQCVGGEPSIRLRLLLSALGASKL